jgi:hypothetical protein
VEVGTWISNHVRSFFDPHSSFACSFSYVHSPLLSQLTIGWVGKSGKHSDRKELYIRWLLNRTNADSTTLPYTTLHLAYSPGIPAGDEFKAECERLAAVAANESRPLVGFITRGSAETKEVRREYMRRGVCVCVCETTMFNAVCTVRSCAVLWVQRCYACVDTGITLPLSLYFVGTSVE